MLHELAHVMGIVLVGRRYFTPIKLGGKVTEDDLPLEKPAILEVEDGHEGDARDYHIGEPGEYIEKLIFGGKVAFILEKKEQFPNARTVYVQTTEASNFGQVLDPIELGFLLQSDPSNLFPCEARLSNTFYLEGHICRSAENNLTVLEQKVKDKTVRREFMRCEHPGSGPVNPDAKPLVPYVTPKLGRRQTIGAFFTRQKGKLPWKRHLNADKIEYPTPWQNLKRSRSVNTLSRKAVLTGPANMSTPLLDKLYSKSRG